MRRSLKELGVTLTLNPQTYYISVTTFGTIWAIPVETVSNGKDNV